MVHLPARTCLLLDSHRHYRRHPECVSAIAAPMYQGRHLSSRVSDLSSSFKISRSTTPSSQQQHAAEYHRNRLVQAYQQDPTPLPQPTLMTSITNRILQPRSSSSTHIALSIQLQNPSPLAITSLHLYCI